MNGWNTLSGPFDGPVFSSAVEPPLVMVWEEELPIRKYGDGILGGGGGRVFVTVNGTGWQVRAMDSGELCCEWPESRMDEETFAWWWIDGFVFSRTAWYRDDDGPVSRSAVSVLDGTSGAREDREVRAAFHAVGHSYRTDEKLLYLQGGALRIDSPEWTFTPWKCSLSLDAMLAMHVDTDSILVTANAESPYPGKRLLCLDRASGGLRWMVEERDQALFLRKVGEGLLITHNKDAIHGRSASTGEILWSIDSSDGFDHATGIVICEGTVFWKTEWKTITAREASSERFGGDSARAWPRCPIPSSRAIWCGSPRWASTTRRTVWSLSTRDPVRRSGR